MAIVNYQSARTRSRQQEHRSVCYSRLGKEGSAAIRGRQKASHRLMIRAGASNFPQSEDGILARGLFSRAPRATQVDIVKMLSPNNPWAARNYSQAQKSRQARQAGAGKRKAYGWHSV